MAQAAKGLFSILHVIIIARYQHLCHERKTSNEKVDFTLVYEYNQISAWLFVATGNHAKAISLSSPLMAVFMSTWHHSDCDSNQT